jgi:predicted transposase/invertase (TIGR01784 family)
MGEEIRKIINQPHDTFFKHTFGDKEISKEFIKTYIEEEITREMDLNQLEIIDGTYIDKKLEKTYSDILYKTKIKNTDTYIYILYEHKSYPDKKTTFQLLEYINKIMKKTLNPKTSKTNIIIPVLIYHGSQKWNMSNKLIDHIENREKYPEKINKYIPNYEYEIIELNDKTNQEIKGPILLKIILETLKAIKQKEKNKFIDNFKKILNLMDSYEKIDSQKAREIFGFIIYYILITRDDTDEYELKEIDIKRGDLIMTRGRQLYEDGIKKGIEKGKLEAAKDLLKEKIDKNVISKAMGISIDQIKKIEEEMKENKN